jgi:hypothetical protein
MSERERNKDKQKNTQTVNYFYLSPTDSLRSLPSIHFSGMAYWRRSQYVHPKLRYLLPSSGWRRFVSPKHWKPTSPRAVARSTSSPPRNLEMLQSNHVACLLNIWSEYGVSHNILSKPKIDSFSLLVCKDLWSVFQDILVTSYQPPHKGRD